MTAPTVTTKGIDGLAETEPPSDRSIGGDSRLHLDISDGPVVVPEHHYRRGDEHARGGLGRIVRGRDQRLGRAVAIKELLHETTINRARFMREARITARLQHPGIVPIYEAGVWPNGQPFYAMRLVAGKPLSQAITACESLADRMALLSRILIVAETMAYAHSERVIHRDLKPANILVGDYGETVVIDWGIAKELDQPETDGTDTASILASADLTVDGQVMGTPWYMAPEQARGELVDERADVYAIGAMIYHLLAGVPPHSGTTDKVVTAVAAGVAPPPLPTRVTGVPADLVAVVGKAMAVDRDARYPSAAELAADLRRFLDGRLVSVHRYGLGALLRRWVSRHRAAVAVAAVAAVTLLVGGAIGLANIFAARDEARRQETLATSRAHELGAQRDTLLLAQAESALERDPTQALVWLKKYPDDGAEWNRVRSVAADAQSRGVSRHVLQHGEQVWTAAMTADGGQLATASEDHVSLWDLQSGARLDVFDRGDTHLVVMSPDGRTVAAAGLDNDVWLWRDRTLRRLTGHTARVWQLQLTPDAHVVSTAEDGTIRIWPPSGAAPTVIPTVTGAEYKPVLLAEGSQLVTLDPDGTLQIRSLSGAMIRRIGMTSGTVRALAASAQGDVGVSDDEGVRVWRSSGGAPLRLGQRTFRPLGLAFAGNAILVGADPDVGLSAWTIPEGREMTLTGHSAELTNMTVSATGAIATGDVSGEVRVWRYAAKTGTFTSTRLVGHSGAVSDLVFAPGDQRLVTTSFDHTTRVWDLLPPRGVVLRLPSIGPFDLLYVDDDHALVTSVSSGAVLRVERDGATPVEIGRHGGQAYTLARTTDGSLIASGAFDGTVAIWMARTRTWSATSTGSRQVWDVQFSPDNRWLAAGGDRGAYLGPATGPLVALPGHEMGAVNVQFSPDGSLLAASSGDGTIRLWDVANTRLRQVLRGHSKMPTRPTFTPDGQHLVSGGWDGEIRYWDLATGESYLLGRHQGPSRAIAIRPDGARAASAGADGDVRLWDLASRSGTLLGHHGGEARDVAFSPDGRSLASAGHDGSVQLWDLASRSSEPLRGANKFQRVAFRSDGRELAASCSDGTLHLWPLPLPHAVPIEPGALRAWLRATTTAEPR